MDVLEKLEILTDAAKYDVACTSSGVDRSNNTKGLGSAVGCGICHTFAADGRCVSLLKILQTNYCIYDCAYCVNRVSNDTKRAAFTPEEVADLTINFYKRNYIEGLFLSSGVIKSPDYTCEMLIKTLTLVRHTYKFNGYIHVKAIPGADSLLLTRLGMLADRMSVNIEMPSQASLNLLAPDKSKISIVKPMGLISKGIAQSKYEVQRYRSAPKFVPAGQSTQMIVGASPDTDMQILNLTQSLYKTYSLKRVFFSAYMPVSDNPALPSTMTKPPLLREHRLYQADWLLRFYGFTADELLDDKNPNFNPLVDPKCNWAINHMEHFPVEVNKAPLELLLRVPGIGVTSAKRIINARRTTTLDFTALKKIGVVLKRAQYFLLCSGKTVQGLNLTHNTVLAGLLSDKSLDMLNSQRQTQLSFNDIDTIDREERLACLTGQL